MTEKVKQFESQTQGTVRAAEKPSRAKYSYPYYNMETSLNVARDIHEKGGGSCSPDQLAAFLGYKSVRSGTYLTRTSAARQFGFIQSVDGMIGVTDRAQKILNPVMPEDAVMAKTNAFLSVGLFNAIYQKYLGQTLPPEIGLKNLLTTNYSLSKDRVKPAIRVFYESADQAGFFETAGNRTKLIKPSIKHDDQQQKPDDFPDPEVHSDEQHKQKGKGGGGGEPPGVHSAIIGLLRELPAPGDTWKKTKKDAFKAAFAAILDFIYPTDDEAIGE